MKTTIKDLMEERRIELVKTYGRSPLYLTCVIREHDATCAKLGKLLNLVVAVEAN